MNQFKEQPLEQLLGINCFTVWMFHGGIILSVPLEEDLLGWGLWWDWGSSIFTILCCILILAAEGILAFKPLLSTMLPLRSQYVIYYHVSIVLPMSPKFVGRTCQCGYLDHAFTPHCTILPNNTGAITHRWTPRQQQMHVLATLLIMVIEIRFNFQIHMQCSENAISKIAFNIQWNLKQI